MYDNILLPTDGSEGMDAVIDHTRELAEKHDATLHALYVANTASLTDLPMESAWDGVTAALQQQGEEAIEVVSEQVGDHPIESKVAEGSPSQEIISYAADNDCDLIVMGTHGRSGVDRLLLGSVAERVVRSSPVPVLTIRVDGQSQ